MGVEAAHAYWARLQASAAAQCLDVVSILLQVENNSSAPRVHLIVDVSEVKHQRTPLKAGQVCSYEEDAVVCQH